MNQSPDKYKRKSNLLSLLHKIIKWGWIAIAIIIALGALLSANGGLFNPDVTSFPAVFAMSFPMWMIALVIVALASLFFARKISFSLWVVALFCTGGLNDFCPINLFHSSSYEAADSTRVINVMTYNTYGFVDDQGIYPYGTNRTASTIINSGADIVMLQEIGFSEYAIFNRFTYSQADSLNKIYPYRMFNENAMTGILSRYPLEWVELPQPGDKYAGWEGAIATIDSTKVLLVSLHLQSLGLNNEDKLVYHNISSGDNITNLSKAGKQIYNKVAAAMKRRAFQARLLRQYLDSLQCPNMLIAGDFNDINGCYAMRTLCGDDLQSTFSAVGHGPTITYHRDRFLFNIDHILYSGVLKPLSISTGSIKSSDHYPVYATFIIEDR